MTIELESHKGVKMVNPTVELISTLDNPIKETFTPELVFVDGDRIRISHTMPPQPYVKGTWTDEDVDNAINKYLQSIDLEK